MNSLSRQALNYLNASEKGDKAALNKLCCLIMLMDKEYKSKINQLDEVLTFHILNHLSDNCIANLRESNRIDQFFDILVRSLALSDLKLSDTQLIAFNRCRSFAAVIIGDFKASEVDTEIKHTAETTPDIDDMIDDDAEVDVETETEKEVEFVDTECNHMPAPALESIKIESKSSSLNKKGQFDQIYKLWNHKHNPVLKDTQSA